MPPPFAAFTEAEHRERLDRARTALRAGGLAGCVCIGPEHLNYLAGYDSLAFFRARSMTIITSHIRSHVKLL